MYICCVLKNWWKTTTVTIYDYNYIHGIYILNPKRRTEEFSHQLLNYLTFGEQSESIGMWQSCRISRPTPLILTRVRLRVNLRVNSHLSGWLQYLEVHLDPCNCLTLVWWYRFLTTVLGAIELASTMDWRQRQEYNANTNRIKLKIVPWNIPATTQTGCR